MNRVGQNSRMAGCRWYSIAAISFLIAWGAAATASAQIEISLKLDKATYMAHEPVAGTLTLTNRAGRDLILDGKNGESWLDFHVTDPRQRLLSPIRNSKKEAPLILKSGVPVEKRVVITSFYPMGSTGLYRMKAQVYFPPLGRYFESNRVTTTIVEGHKMWSQTFGVPTGFVGAGQYRIYALLTFYEGARNRLLYFRLSDSDTGIVRRTYSLGRYISVRQPQYAVDSKSHLHVLHLTGPQTYMHTVVDPSGEPFIRQAYKDQDSTRPELIVNSANGEVAVQGGISVEDANTPYENREFKKISERPPGMPRL